MSFLGIRFDKHTLGNLIKNVSPALAFTPVGALGAGVAGALGERLRGKTRFGDIARAGISNAVIGAGAHSAAGLFKNALHGGASAASTAAPTVTGTDAGAASIGSGAPASAGVMDSGSAIDSAYSAAAPVTKAPNTFLNAAKGVAKGVGSFTKNNANAVGLGLQGVGQLASAGSENRMNDAQTNLLEQRYGMTEEDRKRRQEMDDYLASLNLGPLTPRSADPYTQAGSA